VPRLGFFLPLLPALAGLVLSAWRFRAGDPFLGLVLAEGGMVLMVVLAARVREEPR
jgi:hypothetical protein